jgi:Uma2 family endonuclease
MTTILQEAAAGRATVVPWTVEAYRRALAEGLLPEDTAVELIEGFIVRKNRAQAGDNPMTIGDRHRVAVLRLAQSAPAFEQHGCFLQTQQPVSLPPASEPEPDAAVIRGTIDDYLESPPGAADVLCVVEVADSSLALDLGPKLTVYAEARIPQYVVVDLVNDRIIVHEQPAGNTYTRVSLVRRGEMVALSAGEALISIAADRLVITR